MNDLEIQVFASSIACWSFNNLLHHHHHPPTHLLQCHHLLPLPECQASERAASPLTLRHFPVDMCFCQRLDLPEIKSTELSYYDLFPEASLSLSPLCPLLSLYPSVFLSLLPARCSHLWRHHLIFPPFRQKHPKIDRKVSSGDQARGFSASQSMS